MDPSNLLEDRLAVRIGVVHRVDGMNTGVEMQSAIDNIFIMRRRRRRREKGKYASGKTRRN
jgi:hypothetical protein